MTPLPAFTTWLEQHRTVVDALCLDIDGVLLNSRRRLPGSRRLIDLLQRLKLPYVLVTNDGNHATAEKALRLQQAGLAINADQIISCGHAITTWAVQTNRVKALFFVMGDTGTPCFVEAAGLKVTRDLKRLEACAGVVIGEENYHWEPVINAVINYLINHPDAPLVVPNPDEFYPGPKLKIHVAAGGIARFIQQILKSYGMTITPIFLGKPFAPIYLLARQALEEHLGHATLPEKILMLGDNLAADIQGGRNMGYTTALLLTGVTSSTALRASKLIPDMVFECL